MVRASAPACAHRVLRPFLEAYQHTNRILNISVSPADSHQFPRLLNYLTAPNVLIRWAALASSAIPGLFVEIGRRLQAADGHVVLTRCDQQIGELLYPSFLVALRLKLLSQTR